MQLRFLFAVGFLAHVSLAQGRDTAARTSVVVVSGIVHDSIAHRPLAGATVQLVGTEGHADFARTTTTDESGIFALRDIPDGSYMLGFFHAMLDSLGVEPPTRAVRIEGQKPVRADLAIPSPRRLRTVICGPRARSDSSGLVVGTVRDARDGAPMPRVAVFGEWMEFTLMRGGLVRRIPRLVAVTGDNGWFAMCNVPSAGTMTLMASRDGDSTDVIDVQVPPEGFIRRELYLGYATTIVTGGSAVTGSSAQTADSLARAPRRMRTGDGRLTGFVLAAVGGRRLGGALVSIVDGPQVRANDAGEWTLSDAPVGSRMLEVRAVGYYPERRQVNVTAGAPPITVTLSTLESVLDTVRIIARAGRTREIQGFIERRRSGLGHFLTAEDVARRGALVTSDVFRTVPGLRLERGFGEATLLMRSAFGDCRPAFYINGLYMNLSAEDVDDWVRPKEILGIEVYTGESTPPQFQRSLSGCGSIVIWMK